MWQYYQSNYPGQVQVLGCEVFDGAPSQVQSYVNATGSTFPFLLRCFNGPPAGNFVTWYGERDNFVVINKQGIVRYRAAQTHPYSDGYHLDEIRGCVDSLVSLPGADADTPAPLALAVSASPNPCRGRADVSLALPRDEAAVRVSVHDLAGRRVQVLWDGPSAAGVRRLVWDTRDRAGRPVPPGVYLMRAELGDRVARARVVVAR